MSIQTSYTDARAHLARYLDAVTDDREVVVVRRRGREDVAMVAASELSSLEETAHLLRSPRNAERLLSALNSALEGQGESTSVERLCQDVGLERAD